MPKTIRYDAHKEHPLVLVDIGGSSGGNGRSFTCDGCGCRGAGPRYRCGACDFDLHELCATAPGTAWFFFHGQHPLALELAVEDGGDGSPRHCDICEMDIHGMHYRCRPCGFDAHPLPGAAVSPLHPEHLVMLSVGGPEECTRCGADCVWRYRCGVCDVNLHPRCLLGTDETPLNIPRSN
uniref:DC1 domain-containing protein n=1 Tax=Setaria viridis TaxID=4556 RepID=A0A4U6T6W5_SETVI|nr:hypothetical protein SEVIR_9G501000v2 [Setaria viridis]